MYILAFANNNNHPIMPEAAPSQEVEVVRGQPELVNLFEIAGRTISLVDIASMCIERYNSEALAIAVFPKTKGSAVIRLHFSVDQITAELSGTLEEERRSKIEELNNRVQQAFDGLRAAWDKFEQSMSAQIVHEAARLIADRAGKVVRQ